MKVLLEATLRLIAEDAREQVHPVFPLPQPPNLHRVKPQRAKLRVVYAPVLARSEAKSSVERSL